jgi:hypothetical protein
MPREISQTIEINASPDQVWALLTDTASFPSWNPFIRKLEGQLTVGAKLLVVIQPPGRRPSTFRPTVLTVAPARELRWLGRLLIPGLFDGEHSLRLEPTPDGGTRFTQAEKFNGILVAPFKGILDSTATGFEQMNQALKARVENGQGAQL